MVHDAIKNKDVHCLHNKVLTVATALESFQKQLEKMPTHVFKMSWQWEALKRTNAALKPFWICNEKDYQVSKSQHSQIQTQIQIQIQIHINTKSKLTTTN